MNEIKKAKLDKYFSTTEQAIKDAQKNLTKAKGVCINLDDIAKEFLEVAKNYFSDAKHFQKKGDGITAFAALNYAHGWLDAGVKLGLFKVKDSKLFAYVE